MWGQQPGDSATWVLSRPRAHFCKGVVFTAIWYFWFFSYCEVSLRVLRVNHTPIQNNQRQPRFFVKQNFSGPPSPFLSYRSRLPSVVEQRSCFTRGVWGCGTVATRNGAHCPFTLEFSFVRSLSRVGLKSSFPLYFFFCKNIKNHLLCICKRVCGEPALPCRRFGDQA